MNKQKRKELFYQISALLILIGAAGFFFLPDLKYVMLVGVAGFGATTFTTPYPGKSVRGKRLFNMQIFAVILMVISCYLLFNEFKEWVIAMLVAAILILYSSIAIPKELEKEDKEK
ncbi:hypothetical protein [Dysgonomonas sp. 520]|uniref:hypothetical protein n=1 Tax=Dysgonomonas sp. 520 TaxID=2302931 RepID=UPI0013D84062|nr:hypothetical protein [Dysgonomonas sp. 520]NDW08122.1 hypothetical protein [Dysgonomonas sp. 520]